MAYHFRFSRCFVRGVLAGGLLAVAWTARADSGAGQKIAASGASGVPACASCHGAKGEGMAAAGFPYLAGQGAAYIAAQLQDFAQGARSNPIMAPIAKGLNAEQIQAVAAYYAGLPPPFDIRALSGHQDTYPEKEDSGAWLANRGDWDSNIPACIQCHGPGGVGVGGQFPALAGLPAQYIQAQLMAWKDNKRAPGPQGLMGEIARRMTEKQMGMVAAYFSALPKAVMETAVPKEGAKQ